MARPFVAPPGVPADRMEALRNSFQATVSDREFLAEAKKLNIPVNAADWCELEKLISDVYATPQPIIARAAKIVSGK